MDKLIILKGKDATRFEERMKNPPKISSEERERMRKNYLTLMSKFKG